MMLIEPSVFLSGMFSSQKNVILHKLKYTHKIFDRSRLFSTFTRNSASVCRLVCHAMFMLYRKWFEAVLCFFVYTFIRFFGYLQVSED